MRRVFSVILMIVALVAGYYAYDLYFSSGFLQSNSGEDIIYKTGNTTGNLANSGYILRIKNDLFGNINPEYTGIYKSDLKFKKQTRISKDESFYLNTDGEWIYYINSSDKNTVYRVGINGNGRTKLNSSESDALNWENGWLFYLDRKNGSIICKMSSDGKINKILLDEKYCSNLLVKDGWVYYVRKGYLNRINIDGRDHIVLTKIRTAYYQKDYTWKGNFDISGYYLYYPGVDGSLYKIRIDGKENELVKKGKIESINIYKNHVYYFDADKKTMFRFNIDNPEVQDYILGGSLYYNLNIVNDDGVLYKDKTMKDGPLYMVLMNLSAN